MLADYEFIHLLCLITLTDGHILLENYLSGHLVDQVNWYSYRAAAAATVAANSEESTLGFKLEFRDGV